MSGTELGEWETCTTDNEGHLHQPAHTVTSATMSADHPTEPHNKGNTPLPTDSTSFK